MNNPTRRILLGSVASLVIAGPVFADAPLVQADLIMVYKDSRRLYLYRDEQLLRTYRIDLGWAPEGDKETEGDGRTPEGTYVINRRNPNSNFHLSLGISYPDPRQIALANLAGIDPGGEIFIHGGRGRGRPRDWTAGCIAVNNRDIEEIWQMVPDGTPIVIRP